MKCPYCVSELPAAYSGLYCPDCGKPLWNVQKTPKNGEPEIDLSKPSEGNTMGESIFLEPSGEQVPIQQQQPAPQPFSTPQNLPFWQETEQPIPILRRPQMKQDPKECPWEERDSVGAITGLVKTCFQCTFAPGEFFKKLPPRSGYGDALLFAMLVNVFAALVSFGWALVSAKWLTFFEEFFTSQPELADAYHKLAQRFTLPALIKPVLLSPLTTIVVVLLLSLVFNILLLIMRGSRNGFQATFRAVCYSSAPKILLAFPILGWLVYALWAPIVLIVGLAKVHDNPTWKATLAVVLPFTLLMLVVLALAVGVFLMVMNGELDLSTLAR